MNHRPFMYLALLSPVVFTYGWLAGEGGWVLERLGPSVLAYVVAPLAVVVTVLLGPLSAVGALACVDEVAARGRRSAWYAVPGAVGGFAALAVDVWCLVFVLGPAC